MYIRNGGARCSRQKVPRSVIHTDPKLRTEKMFRISFLTLFVAAVVVVTAFVATGVEARPVDHLTDDGSIKVGHTLVIL